MSMVAMNDTALHGRVRSAAWGYAVKIGPPNDGLLYSLGDALSHTIDRPRLAITRSESGENAARPQT